MKISRTDKAGIWLLCGRDDRLKPWFTKGLEIVEVGALGVYVGVMWVGHRS